MSYQPGSHKWGRKSREKLQLAHPLLVRMAERAIIVSPMDMTILDTHRGEEEQNAAFDSGASTKRFPESTHNHLATMDDVDEGWARTIGEPLSLAMDIAPWINGRQAPWAWEEEYRWLNGFVCAIGMEVVAPYGFYIRTGVDWDMDGDQREHKLEDAPHLELRRLS